MSAGRQPALRPGQRRVEPSQSAPGGVRCPPARPQPPLQGRTAEGVERAGPSSSGHLSPAEGPTHINLPPPSTPPPSTPHPKISRFGHVGKKNKQKKRHLLEQGCPLLQHQRLTEEILTRGQTLRLHIRSQGKLSVMNFALLSTSFQSWES